MKIVTGILLLALLASPAQADDPLSRSISLKVDYSFLQQVLYEQLYTGPNQEMDIRIDDLGCNRIRLSNPRIEGHKDLLHIVNQSLVDVGLPTGSACVPLFQWSGTIESSHRPRVDQDRTALYFELVDVDAYNADKTPLVQGRAYELLKQFAKPRISDLQIDLLPVLTKIRQLLPAVLPEKNIAAINQILDSLSFTTIDIKPELLQVALEFKVSSNPSVTAYEPPLTKAELDRWEQSSRYWDAFLTYTVKQIAAHSHSADVREALLNLLIETRYDILRALSGPATPGTDPVRRMFINVWSQLVPLLRAVSRDLQGAMPLQYLTFIAAGDMLQILDRMGPDIGLEITSDGLRRLARMLAPEDASDPLEYNLDIDPALRELFGFDLPESSNEQVPVDILSWFIQSAHAATDSAALRNKLKNWVPKRNEVSEYLAQVHQLLNETTISTINTSNLDAQYRQLYHDMLLATAWLESCWRQFIRTDGKIKVITSSTGSVGIMQVNRKVWRGLYDPGKLETHIAYNANAGSEILLHYFKDYALKKELGNIGSVDDLARATYAAYNGGPRQLTRYREAATPERLHKIDLSFWKKYQTIKSGNIKAVAGCYGETASAVKTNSLPANNKKIVESPSRHAGLLQANPDNYTIQLMSSRSEPQMIKYMQENKLGGKAEYYSYRHNNEIWYGLVYGSFATRNAAESKAQALQKSMGLSSPWVRQISSIQKLSK